MQIRGFCIRILLKVAFIGNNYLNLSHHAIQQDGVARL